MAYAINMVQRVSDGGVYTGGGFIEITNPANYRLAAFFGGDPDSVPQLVNGLASGEYRILPYWMPGQAGQNLPAYGGNLFSNFTAGMAANTVDVNGEERNNIFTGDFGNLYSDWQANGYPTLLFFFTETQNNNFFCVLLSYWDCSGCLEEFIGFYWAEVYLVNTGVAESSNSSYSNFSGESVQWAFLI